MKIGSTADLIMAYTAKYMRALFRSILRLLIRLVCFRLVGQVEVRGLENVPVNEGAILMVNHTSYIDGILCIGAVTHRYVIPMAKTEHFTNRWYGLLFRIWGACPVQRGLIDRTALKKSVELLNQNELLLIFPEGTLHEQGLSVPKNGLAYLASKVDKVIVPIGISGAAAWRQELKQRRRPRILINIGKPFRLRVVMGAPLNHKHLSQLMHGAMHQLALAIEDPSLRGNYVDSDESTNATVLD